MKKAYIVIANYEYETNVLTGVYSTMEKAKIGLEKAKDNIMYSDADSFDIAEVEIDKNINVEGGVEFDSI